MRPCAPVFERHGQVYQASPALRNEENALPALALNACDPLALSGAHVYREVSSPTFRHSGRPAWIPPCTRSRRPFAPCDQNDKALSGNPAVAGSTACRPPAEFAMAEAASHLLLFDVSPGLLEVDGE